MEKIRVASAALSEGLRRHPSVVFVQTESEEYSASFQKRAAVRLGSRQVGQVDVFLFGGFF